MATLKDNAKRAVAVIDRAIGYIKEMGIDVPDDIPVEQQVDKILEITGGGDYVTLEAHAGDFAANEGLAGASVDILLDSGRLASLSTDKNGTARRRWHIDRAGYETLLTAPRVKSGVKKPWYHAANFINELSANNTAIVWFRTPSAQYNSFAFPFVMENALTHTHFEMRGNETTGAQSMAFYVKGAYKSTGAGVVQPDTDYIMAIRQNAETGVFTGFVFDRKYSGTIGTGTIGGKYAAVGRNDVGYYAFNGVVKRVEIWNRELTDTEIFRIMAGERLEGAFARLLPENITDTAWFDEDGVRSLTLRSTDHQYVHQGQLQAFFSKKGYADELHYVELPSYDAADGGIRVAQVMYGHDVLNVFPGEIAMSTAGGTQTLQVTSPWPVHGILPLAEWITPVLNGKTLTVTISENVGKERRGEVVIFTGDRQFRVPVVQEGRDTNSYVELEVDSSDGTFIVPFSYPELNTGKYSVNVYVNGVFHGNAAGVIDSKAGSGYELTGLSGPTALITLIPPTFKVGWCRAFGFNYTTEGCNALENKAKVLKSLHDPDYAYCASETNAGYSFKSHQFYQCVNLTQICDDSLPDTITSINNIFRGRQYAHCSSLTVPAREYIPAAVDTIGSFEFRIRQYEGCTSLLSAAEEAFPEHLTNTDIGGLFRYAQYVNCSSLTVPSSIERISDNVTTIGDYFRHAQYAKCTISGTPPEEALPDTVNTIGTYFRNAQYEETKISRTVAEAMSRNIVSVGAGFRCQQYRYCSNLLIGGHVHHHRFAEYLNADDNNYQRMFSSYIGITTPDTTPRYYVDETHTLAAPVTGLTPTARKSYLTNRTGLEDYNDLDPNWK